MQYPSSVELNTLPVKAETKDKGCCGNAKDLNA